MLSIGEFSKICQVSTKTLRYYAEIGLLLPSEINPETKYRYYAIKQLETMLFINRLKSYQFSLEEIKSIITSEGIQEEVLYEQLTRKKEQMKEQEKVIQHNLIQLEQDISNIKEGKAIMSYLDEIDVQLVEVPLMYLLSIRKNVQKHVMTYAYKSCFNELLKTIHTQNLTIIAPPRVLFHSKEFTPFGFDIEFAIPVKEYVTGTRDFHPGLCLKTAVYGSYTELTSVYAKQIEWAEEEGYEGYDALFEVYVNDLSQVHDEKELITEVYYPVKKLLRNAQ